MPVALLPSSAAIHVVCLLENIQRDKWNTNARTETVRAAQTVDAENPIIPLQFRPPPDDTDGEATNPGPEGNSSPPAECCSVNRNLNIINVASPMSNNIEWNDRGRQPLQEESCVSGLALKPLENWPTETSLHSNVSELVSLRADEQIYTVAAQRAVRTRGDEESEGATRGEPPTPVAVRVPYRTQGEGLGSHKAPRAKKMRWSSLGPHSSEVTCTIAAKQFQEIDDPSMKITPATIARAPNGAKQAETLTDAQRMALKSIGKAKTKTTSSKWPS